MTSALVTINPCEENEVNVYFIVSFCVTRGPLVENCSPAKCLFHNQLVANA